MLEEFKDGVWLIELAALADPELVPQTIAIEAFARLDANEDITEQAARCGGTTSGRDRLAAASKRKRRALDRDVAAARQSMGDDVFSAAWAMGCGMTMERAIEYVLEKSDA